MRSTPADSAMADAWQRARRSVTYLRDLPTSGNGPYSPLFCFSLLLALGVMIEIAG